MLAYIRRLREVRRRDDGASAVEYGLIIAAVAALVLAVAFGLGNLVSDVFSDTCTEIETGVADEDVSCTPEGGGGAGG